MNARGASLLALAGLVVVGVGGWLLWPADSPRVARPSSPDDDLEMLAVILDAAGPRVNDVLVAGPDALYVAHGVDGTIEAFTKRGGEPRVLARIGAPVQGMAMSGHAVALTSGHAVLRVPIEGGAPVVVSDKLTRPHAIASDGTWDFVVDVAGPSGGLLRASTVVRLPAAGGDPVVVGRYEGEVTNVALDGTSAYWADRLEGNIMTVPEGAGAPRVLTSSRGLPGQVVVVGDAVAWVEKRSESLWAMPKTGGAPLQLTQDFAGFARVVGTRDAVVWTPESPVEGSLRVLSVPATGGGVSAISPDVPEIDGLATDGSALYWLRDDTPSQVPAPD